MTHTVSNLLNWYRGNARALPWRNPPGEALPTDPDWPYRVWLSEIMLQQTTVAAVKAYFAAFTARWPTVAALAAADDADVMQAWAGLGYYARARNLLACARAVVADHGGRFPSDEDALRTLPGIGPYTSAAIAAFAFGRHAIVIDGNVERVVTRLDAIDTPLPAARPQIRGALETLTPQNASDFAQALMDLATSICTPRNPRCLICPLSPDCRAARSPNPADWPRKAPKRPRPTRRGTAWWIEAQGQILTIVRPAKGLLGGMRALPSSDWHDTEPAPAPPLPGNWQNLGAISHGFTHFELILSVHALSLPQKPQLARADLSGALLEAAWVNVEDIPGAGLPTLFKKAAVLARAHLPEAA
ncbi:A/G-specific adenine glycosylase [Polymorphobacter glacialis]|uniref:Adenine DNA glycosylase n=1 Tax=Sandarakinorhabdus glacialis TaxID=1614636 RepID=A0A916ZKZ7_9SPHN|nr:A/G-specific adenine glycosylase [Polymorphobacter glacialis]GGE01343.1 A/G-specific adenine glycosylase [Polymorphobacter glacialis]